MKALLQICLCGTGGFLFAAEVTRETIQAAYLYRLSEFVDFPSDSPAGSAKLCLCVMGDERLRKSLAGSVEGKSIAGRPVIVRSPANSQEARTCHVLFLTGRKPAVLAQLSELLSDPILTVSDIPEAHDAGSVVIFHLKDNQLHFEINVDNAKRRKLLISSRLIQLSRSSQ